MNLIRNRATSLYVLGLYNISHKGFDVCHYGGAAENIDANTNATFDAAGTTANPYLAGSLEVGGCAPQLCGSTHRCPDRPAVTGYRRSQKS
jgi:hypothetical protein